MSAYGGNTSKSASVQASVSIFCPINRMPSFRAIESRGAHGALADGTPLAALQAHATLLQAPRGTADLDGLWSLLAVGRPSCSRPRDPASGPVTRGATSTGRCPPSRATTISCCGSRRSGRSPTVPPRRRVSRPQSAPSPTAAMQPCSRSSRSSVGPPPTRPSSRRSRPRSPTTPRTMPASVSSRPQPSPTIPGSPHSSPGCSARPTSPRSCAPPRRADSRPGPIPTLLDDLWRAGADGGPELRFACARALLAIRSARAGEAAAALATATVGSSEPFDRLLARARAWSLGRPRPRRGPGLRIAQIFMQGRLDGELTSAGAGDGGGISTLLVHLGRALGSEPEIARVVTIARALAEPETGWGHTQAERGPEPWGLDRAGAVRPGRVPAGSGACGSIGSSSSGRWKPRSRMLGGFDVAHLRFADAGAFAAARVCRRLGIPVAFTAAPDPHGVIEAAEQRGELTRETFPAAELSEHYLFRAQLVADLLGQAEAVVVLPRPRARAALRDADRRARSRRSSDGKRAHDRGRDLAGRRSTGASSELARAGRDGGLPARRQRSCSTASPPCRTTPRPAAARQRRPPAPREGPPAPARGVGRRRRPPSLAQPRDRRRRPRAADAGGAHWCSGSSTTSAHASHAPATVSCCSAIARIMRWRRCSASRATGLGSLVAAHGVYACTSQKEEFGVALLEAMATGLAVVAPNAGGPATYVQEGLTGSLADTSSVADVREALRRAAAARADEPRARRTSNLVRSHYTIEAMAASLAGVYTDVVREPGRGRGVTVLVVVPDYASHWYPLSAVAETLRSRGHRVVVATGRTLAPLVAADGHEHVELTLGVGQQRRGAAGGRRGGVGRVLRRDPRGNGRDAAVPGRATPARSPLGATGRRRAAPPDRRDGRARHRPRRPARIRCHRRPARPAGAVPLVPSRAPVPAACAEERSSAIPGSGRLASRRLPRRSSR